MFHPINELQWATFLGNSFPVDNPDIIIIPNWKTYSNVNLTTVAGIDKFIDEVNADVLAVEACDPFVKENFGVEGIGEGLVLRERNYPELFFKAKGEKHSVVKQKAPVEKDFKKFAKVNEYIEYAVTENRVKQGMGEVGCEDKKQIGQVIKWVQQDVIKECIDELGDLAWDDVKGSVASTTAILVKQLLDKMYMPDE